jgi:hypothetical protein
MKEKQANAEKTVGWNGWRLGQWFAMLWWQCGNRPLARRPGEKEVREQPE